MRKRKPTDDEIIEAASKEQRADQPDGLHPRFWPLDQRLHHYARNAFPHPGKRLIDYSAWQHAVADQIATRNRGDAKKALKFPVPGLIELMVFSGDTSFPDPDAAPGTTPLTGQPALAQFVGDEIDRRIGLKPAQEQDKLRAQRDEYVRQGLAQLGGILAASLNLMNVDTEALIDAAQHADVPMPDCLAADLQPDNLASREGGKVHGEIALRLNVLMPTEFRAFSEPLLQQDAIDYFAPLSADEIFERTLRGKDHNGLTPFAGLMGLLSKIPGMRMNKTDLSAALGVVQMVDVEYEKGSDFFCLSAVADQDYNRQLLREFAVKTGLSEKYLDAFCTLYDEGKEPAVAGAASHNGAAHPSSNGGGYAQNVTAERAAKESPWRDF